MGRTLPSVTQLFHIEEEALSRYRRALRRADQHALDDLFNSAQRHLPAAAYAAHTLPMEIFLLSMLLEEHKQLVKLKAELEALKNPGGIPNPPPNSLFSQRAVEDQDDQ